MSRANSHQQYKQYKSAPFNRTVDLKRLHEYTTAQRAAYLGAQCTRLRADDVRHFGHGWGKEMLPAPVTGPGTDCPTDPADWPVGAYTLENTTWPCRLEADPWKYGPKETDLRVWREREREIWNNREERAARWVAAEKRMVESGQRARTAAAVEATATGGSMARARTKAAAAAAVEVVAVTRTAAEVTADVERFLANLDGPDVAPVAPADSDVGRFQAGATAAGAAVRAMGGGLDVPKAGKLRAAGSAKGERTGVGVPGADLSREQILAQAAEGAALRAAREATAAGGETPAAPAVVRLAAAAAVTVARTDSPAGSFFTF